jgi:hypothetical protein
MVFGVLQRIRAAGVCLLEYASSARAENERRRDLALNPGDQPHDVPFRRVRSDGVIEEYSAAMGWTFTIPADPRPRKLDVRVDAAGWERLQELSQRMRRRR